MSGPREQQASSPELVVRRAVEEDLSQLRELGRRTLDVSYLPITGPAYVDHVYAIPAAAFYRARGFTPLSREVDPDGWPDQLWMAKTSIGAARRIPGE